MDAQREFCPAPAWARTTPPGLILWSVAYLPQGHPWGGIIFTVRAVSREEAAHLAERQLRYFYAETPDHFREVSLTPLGERRRHLQVSLR